MSFVYRVVREDEFLTWNRRGLVAKNPEATISVAQHVYSGSQPYFASQFMSTCRSQSAIISFASKRVNKPKRIVAIDILKAQQVSNVGIIDISTRDNAFLFIHNPANGPVPSTKERMAIDNVAKFEEILIVGAIPASCISLLTTSFVYRVLREDECLTWNLHGLFAKNPAATISVAQHVYRGSQPYSASQFISMSKSQRSVISLALTGRKRPKYTVKIDIMKALQLSNVDIIDISTPEKAFIHIHNPVLGPIYSEEEQTAVKYAAKFEEILIVGAIPASCITKFMFVP